MQLKSLLPVALLAVASAGPARPVNPKLLTSVFSSAPRRIAPSSAAAPLCQVQTGTKPPTFRPDFKHLTAEDIVNATLAWANEVCTVNSFLNSPRTTKTTLNTVIAYASDEPTQLKTLSSLPNLSVAGLNAAEVLKANFPMIPENLVNVRLGKTTTYTALVAINFMRCCTVLPAIEILFKEASVASGAFSDGVVPKPIRPLPCASIDCSTGASPGLSI